jgi:hypothetical protein
MKCPNWDDFRHQAQNAICKECSCGASIPWRGNAACLQAWLRFHSSRGNILSCHAAGATQASKRPEDALMSEMPGLHGMPGAPGMSEISDREQS